MKKKICIIVAVPSTAKAFLKDHITKLSEEYDVFLVANISVEQIQVMHEFKIAGYKSIQINRKINLISDIKAVFALRRYFRLMRFYAIHSVTPKAGLITALAGVMSKVPNRIHIFTGQVWATKKGIMRYMLMFMDWLITRLDTHILVDGESQRQYLIEHKIIAANNSQVLGGGSISGVNTKKFLPSDTIRKNIRNELNLSNNQIVYVFLGRLNQDKGIYELLEAYNKLAQARRNVFLLLVGIDEEDCLASLPQFLSIENGVNFHFYGPTPNPEVLLQAGDVFCLPSYREGFGTSVIEASCLGLPVICSDTYGIMDAMIDNETGLRCKTQDADSLYMQMQKLVDDPEFRNFLGNNGRERVLHDFSGEAITSAWLNFYKKL
jgi:glycosyltransferase involved in cell wall biosynthesis